MSEDAESTQYWVDTMPKITLTWCQKNCGVGSPEGRHNIHLPTPCSWHEGTCEEAEADSALWCQCGRES